MVKEFIMGFRLVVTIARAKKVTPQRVHGVDIQCLLRAITSILIRLQ